MRCLRGSSARIAAPQVHIREAGWGPWGFEHVAEDWMACCSALPLSLRFSSVQKPFERLGISHAWEHVQDCLLVPQPQVSEDILVKKVLCGFCG